MSNDCSGAIRAAKSGIEERIQFAEARYVRSCDAVAGTDMLLIALMYSGSNETPLAEKIRPQNLTLRLKNVVFLADTLKRCLWSLEMTLMMLSTSSRSDFA